MENEVTPFRSLKWEYIPVVVGYTGCLATYTQKNSYETYNLSFYDFISDLFYHSLQVTACVCKTVPTKLKIGEHDIILTYLHNKHWSIIKKVLCNILLLILLLLLLYKTHIYRRNVWVLRKIKTTITYKKKKKEKWRYLNDEKISVISVVYKYFVKLGAQFFLGTCRFHKFTSFLLTSSK